MDVDVNTLVKLVSGAIAGAAGTAVLNASTYVDMAVRDRPPSELPEKMVSTFASTAGITVQPHRRVALGALLGYANGLGTGALFGIVRPKSRRVSWFWAGIVLAATTMAMSEGTATAFGQTDPAQWSTADWIADLVPRCLYGWITCIAYDRLVTDR